MALSSGQPYGNVFPVIDPANNQERVALAYNSTDSHLLTWQDNQLTNWNSYAGLFRPWQETGFPFVISGHLGSASLLSNITNHHC